ncbi:hypothetical protein [Brevibacterium renqingii]|uniref:hypothetical protein n=1 Tax=Brevibacterium renqingii TaxID=2776916 RepID=UPI001ADFB07C|nr:hypothetical protein [Brevibacterium renqingii]
MPTTTSHLRPSAVLAASLGLASVLLLTVSTNAAQATPTASAAPVTDQPGSSSSAPQSTGHPTEAAEYADRLVTAWSHGNDQEVKERAHPSVVQALAGHGTAHIKQWRRITADADSEHTAAVYVNRETGDVLTLSVDNRAADRGSEGAVERVRFDS